MFGQALSWRVTVRSFGQELPAFSLEVFQAAKKLLSKLTLGSMLVTLASEINLWAQQKQCLTVVKSMDSGARFPGLASQLLPFLACDFGQIIQFH